VPNKVHTARPTTTIIREKINLGHVEAIPTQNEVCVIFYYHNRKLLSSRKQGNMIQYTVKESALLSNEPTDKCVVSGNGLSIEPPKLKHQEDQSNEPTLNKPKMLKHES
jgi:hypothetical protein